jgi:N-acetyl-anhydromuramyl-L-alanine amidase AmpD
MKLFRTSSPLLLSALFAVASCANASDGSSQDDPQDDVLSTAEQPGLDQKLEQAASKANVPASLLKAIGYVETRWQMVVGEEHEGDAARRHGVMGLDGARLEHAAKLAQHSVADVQSDLQANLDAAAALLAEAGKASDATLGELSSWQSAVDRFSGIEDADARMDYTATVFDVLRTGVSESTESGELIARIAAQRVPTVPRSAVSLAASDYPSAIFRATPNFGARPAGTKISMVVVHSCEGGYAGCWGFLRQSSAQASAHYVVKEDGSEITQLVREADRAWHVAATYRCNLNDSADCGKNGVSVNHFSVGIEHGGFASQSSWPARQIEESAKLTCDITRDQGIVRDRNHIVSHGRLQPETRTDPGPNWPWAQYIDRVRTLCGDGGGGGGAGAIIVDSNNANNDAAKARVELTGAWTSATGTPGYYGSGYWYAETEATSAPATFWFYLDADASRGIDAWWPAGSNRAAAAPFVAYNAAGVELGRVNKDQRSAGSQWNALGTWAFTRGWNRIVLSRWTTVGAVVIADAIRVR